MDNQPPTGTRDAGQPMSDDYLFVAENMYAANRLHIPFIPNNEDIRKVAGDAAGGVDGVLALKGDADDGSKQHGDLPQGVSVYIDSDNLLNVKTKVIAEDGHNVGTIVEHVIHAITSSLWKKLGVALGNIEIEVAESMSHGEFAKKYTASAL